MRRSQAIVVQILPARSSGLKRLPEWPLRFFGCGIDAYLSFIDVQFLLRQVPISLAIARNARWWVRAKATPATSAHTHHWNDGFFLDRLPEVRIPVSQ